jgi:hypothetical protein
MIRPNPGFKTTSTNESVMVFRRIGLSLGWMYGSVGMFRRRINGVQFHILIFGSIEKIVLDAGRNDKRRTILQRIFFAVENRPLAKPGASILKT